MPARIREELGKRADYGTGTSRNVAVILQNGPDSELARTMLMVPESDDPDEAANLAIHDAIESWILSPGNIIRIIDVQVTAPHTPQNLTTSASEKECRRIWGLHAIIDALHFGLVTIGGNCTALARQFGAWNVEITEDGDGTAPTNDDEAVTICLYPAGRECVGQYKCADCEEARMWLVELVAFIDSGGDPDQWHWDLPST